ncbi:inositol polyphosphate 5-phosphatase [Steccherinum ochraceum]|uniref:phosphoinositide 5-phosphatase n=1 Tax=Steccherinum ochraceum TaxID=92696 RepID=A0A4R0RQ48_9APHY|nr:inositol polyphosphate 5-phosphatase [Steccherinum ochraceum]
MYLYLSENPRSLYLVTNQQDERQGRPRRALVFRAAEGKSSQAVVEFLPKDEVNLSNATKVTNRIVKGCLGLISVSGGEHLRSMHHDPDIHRIDPSDIFLAVIVSATEIGNIRPSGPQPESVSKIHEVAFYSLTSSAWDDLIVANEAMPGHAFPDQPESMYREPYSQPNASAPSLLEHPCAPLAKIISAGTFYYAQEPQWDLSSRLSQRLERDDAAAKDVGTYDDRFVWNEFIIRSLLDFRDRLDPEERSDLDRCQFIILAIQGYVGVFTLPLPAPPTNGSPTVATLSLISRLGSKRAGTRFNTRGVDDDGNCANFVETETIFSTDSHWFSYVQVRGSVPLFWEQQGLQTFGQKIQITRPQASQPAFERHFAQLSEEYGHVHAVNLLGTKENEAILTNAYERSLRNAPDLFAGNVLFTNFDFHNQIKMQGHDAMFQVFRRIESVVDSMDKAGFTMADASSCETITQQKGVFRTNCLDCLDRTNFIQDIISRVMLEQYLTLIRREWLHSGTLWSYHRELWAENGDALSRIYAGTGALNTSFTRSGKRTLAGVLSDATKSVSRAYINNFQDKAKQVAIDMFLGNLSTQEQVTIFDPIHDIVNDAMSRRLGEYSTTQPCTVFAGTWNLNGRPPSSESLLPWLFPRNTVPDPDIIVLGFQEIVPLTAQQIVQTDPEKRRVWESKITSTLARRPDPKAEYILLRSHQASTLVGTALLVFVKKELTAVIRNVEAASHKTGLRGMSGNKGAVGIRLDYYDTSFCFLTAHLAAGHSNVEERNTDYRTIANGLHFLRGKTIDSHQNVVWLADTNYRIDLDGEHVRYLAQTDDFDALLAADQLKKAIDDKGAFSEYTEGPLLFRPTYKYDLGTDNYDSSEKARIPAWTDRILYKGDALDLSVYSRAELKGSDHRPVFALFRANVRIIDYALRTALSRVLFENVTSTAPGEKLDEKLASLTFLGGGDSDLPPPSSEDAAWWDISDHPKGIVPPERFADLSVQSGPYNPFDSPIDSPLSSSPSSSEEELYQALTLQAPIAPEPAQSSASATRRPPPPPPSRSTKPRLHKPEVSS